MIISWARLASFCHYGFISDPLIVAKINNETHDPYTIMNPVIAYAHMPLINAHADVSGKPRGLIFGWNLHLHPHIVDASSEGLPVTRAAFTARKHKVYV